MGLPAPRNVKACTALFFAQSFLFSDQIEMVETGDFHGAVRRQPIPSREHLGISPLEIVGQFVRVLRNATTIPQCVTVVEPPKRIPLKAIHLEIRHGSDNVTRDAWSGDSLTCLPTTLQSHAVGALPDSIALISRQFWGFASVLRHTILQNQASIVLSPCISLVRWQFEIQSSQVLYSVVILRKSIPLCRWQSEISEDVEDALLKSDTILQNLSAHQQVACSNCQNGLVF
jgi:hypothetical protein